ncbi:MAG TPA: Crp/Fnr family transcriptional regulator [Candidatus Saccharimonadales bacterium]
MTKATPPALTELLLKARIKRFPTAQILLYEGDSPSDVFLLKKGVVKLHSIDEQGNEKILHLLKPLTVIPLAFFSGEGTPTKWYYTTLTECEVYALPRQELEALMEHDWQTAKCLMNCFSQEVHEVLVRLDSLGKTNIDIKLGIALRYLAVHHSVKGRSDWAVVMFPVNHQLLADMIGMSRESTAIAMKALADKKIVRYRRGTLLKINFNGLEAFIKECSS